MGEVYRADDLKLGQAVALKFLPQDIESDPARLERLLNEVRTARQVAHPHVCRVYDVGEVDGHHFLSMEYVDGEDLASLLRRIGRLPKDKGIQIARQISAGLSAAHDAGILHRDLKPANIMIDGRGRARITDFGLAALGAEIGRDDVRSGTPAYMAPEQLSGRAVSERSDLYALGLVLYEMFTGRPPFRASSAAGLLREQTTSSPPSPAGLVEGLDPAIGRLILRCLDPDPAGRPVTALAVAAALPGGDPLAAALAAGETPSPDLVAAAKDEGHWSPRLAAALLAAAGAGLVLVVALASTSQMIRRMPLHKPPAVLAEKAREILRDLGHSEPPVDSLAAFEPNVPYVQHLTRHRPAREELAGILGNPRPSTLRFRYRQSPHQLARDNNGSIGGWFVDPAPTVPGMIELSLDPVGRLVALTVVPPERDPTAAPIETDWSPLLSAAGLDPESLTPVEPSLYPPVFAERRAAWEGSYPDSPETAIRVEAASLDGRPVAFRISEPWDLPSPADPPPGDSASLRRLVETLAFVVALTAAMVVAFRNLRLGRGDRRGALRFAVYLGVVRLLWLLGAHHLPSDAELGLLIAHLAWSMYRVGIVALFYLALEPYARRLWPRMLVSWMRLLDGRLRDPLVGRDVLVGCLFGIAGAVAGAAVRSIPDAPELWTLEALRGVRHAVTAVIAIHTTSVLGAFIPLMLLLLVRLVSRRTWVAVAVTTAVGFAVFYSGSESIAVNVVAASGAAVVFWVCLFRFGFLSLLVASSVGEWLRQMPLTLDLSAWYAGPSLLTVAVVLGLALAAFRISLGGRPLFRDALMEEPAR